MFFPEMGSFLVYVTTKLRFQFKSEMADIIQGVIIKWN